MVFFHSIDFVLGRTPSDRLAWRTPCYLPISLFDKTKKPKGMKTPKYQNYKFFKRMIAVKEVVYQRHMEMLRLYETYCQQASITDKYYDDDDEELDDDGDSGGEPVIAADETNEADCDDGF